MNKTEQGRSMVEMLGVLAVIGVLTIIGIAGFKIAMNKAKANNLVADMNRLAHIVVMDKFSGYSEEAIQRAVNEHNQKTEYQAEYEYRTPQVFAIKTKNPIDKKMCQQVANLGWNLPLATYLNKVKIEGTFDETKCVDENELIWAFTNDLSTCPDCALGDFDCTPYANRECGTCDSIQYTPRNSDCANNANGQYCVNGHCQQCDANQFWNRNTNACENCHDETYSGDTFWQTVAEHQYDCPGKMFLMPNPHYRLYSCNAKFNRTNADEQSCKACPNRCYLNGSCNWTGGGYSGQIFERNADGSCLCKHCEACPTGQYWDYNSRSCENCHDETYSGDTFWYTVAEHQYDCPGKMFLMPGYPNRLYSCNMQQDRTNADEQSCVACPNRCYLNGTCYPAGSGQAYRRASESDGTCVAN